MAGSRTRATSPGSDAVPPRRSTYRRQPTQRLRPTTVPLTSRLDHRTSGSSSSTAESLDTGSEAFSPPTPLHRVSRNTSIDSENRESPITTESVRHLHHLSPGFHPLRSNPPFSAANVDQFGATSATDDEALTPTRQRRGERHTETWEKSVNNLCRTTLLKHAKEQHNDPEERLKHQQEGRKCDIDGPHSPIFSSALLQCIPLWASDGENDGDDEEDDTFPTASTPPVGLVMSPSLRRATPKPSPTMPTAKFCEDSPATLCLNQTVWRLRAGSRLTELDVFNLLRRLVSLSPFDAIAVDPRLIDKPPSQNLRDQIAEASRTIFVPVYLAEMRHWVLVVLHAPNKLALLDSLPTDDMNEICERVENMQLGLLSKCGNRWQLDSPEVYRVECAPQDRDEDCAIALIVNAMHMLTKTDPLTSTSYRVWRRVLATWIQDDTCVLDDSLCEPLRISLNARHHLGPAKDKLAEYRELQESVGKVAKTPITWDDEPARPAVESQAIHSGLLTELIQSQAALELLESRRFRNYRVEAELKEDIAELERQHRECLANRGHIERILGQLDEDMAQLKRKMKSLQDFVHRWG
ncbi:hypothetical protein G7Z17_g2636 [Cylindrodendrum hubeiense]|uniref:Ubiquitin-like protease family profile domain-containing protein n=1 Tax=Cylindrodendrum hubeiense TaxID=595255 RepID=A0A9P5HG26_9HYPO|nr:hypothetical protein G7Z17_g2636 [Cylindrodendrum hubeiense]